MQNDASQYNPVDTPVGSVMIHPDNKSVAPQPFEDDQSNVSNLRATDTTKLQNQHMIKDLSRNTIAKFLMDTDPNVQADKNSQFTSQPEQPADNMVSQIGRAHV